MRFILLKLLGVFSIDEYCRLLWPVALLSMMISMESSVIAAEGEYTAHIAGAKKPSFLGESAELEASWVSHPSNRRGVCIFGLSCFVIVIVVIVASRRGAVRQILREYKGKPESSLA